MEWRHTGKIWEKVQVSTTVGQAPGKAAAVIANKSVESVTKWGITIVNTNEVS